MKTYYFLPVVAALALAGCGTAYQTGQTPDAVYYSPESTQQPAQYTDYREEGDQYAVAADSEGGNYVVYKDGNEYNDDDYSDYYDDGYYSRRIRMFDQPGGLFSYNYYMMNSPWYGGSYLWNNFGWNSFGWYNNPYMWSPGISLSLGWRSPYYAFGGWYNRWYSPFYHPFYGYGYGHYYPGYYSSGGWGWGGKYGVYNPRPAVTYQPRHAAGSRASRTFRSGSGTTTTSGRTGTVNSPRRVLSSRSSGERVRTGDNSHARRSFQPESGETTRTVRSRSTQSNTTTTHRRRVFRTQSDEQPVRTRSSRSTQSRTRTPVRRTPTRRMIRQPAPRTRTRTVQPSRSYSRPSSTPTRSSGSTRSVSPRRR